MVTSANFVMPDVAVQDGVGTWMMLTKASMIEQVETIEDRTQSILKRISEGQVG